MGEFFLNENVRQCGIQGRKIKTLNRFKITNICMQFIKYFQRVLDTPKVIIPLFSKALFEQFIIRFLIVPSVLVRRIDKLAVEQWLEDEINLYL